MYKYLCISLILIAFNIEAKLPDINAHDVTEKAHEIMKAHAAHKELTPELAKRILNNYLEELDPNKTYFIETDLETYIKPSDAFLTQLIQDYEASKFTIFEQMQALFTKAVDRRHKLEEQIDIETLPAHVRSDEFKDIPWAKTEDDLLTRLKKIKALQLESAAKLSPETKEKSLQRIAKYQTSHEESLLSSDPVIHERTILSNALKATAAALDAHTSYFTPGEASQFMINVQQRLFGIGAQLRDDINGFTVIKIVEGSPAALNKELKVKDRIIAVNGEPIVGMAASDAVELIRGKENTPAVLTVIREVPTEKGVKEEKKLEITILRGEVVLKETRFKTSYEPFGDGVIGYLRLYSFYQDPDSSSATDLENEISKLKSEHHLLGLVLDLRYNSGGLLAQAVAVTGLFITKGIVVSIKDENGRIQHLRDLDNTESWTGPLIVLINRASASASEIVAQTLQDYGRALIIGDDHSYGKGSYQTFTLNADEQNLVNPQGEFKVTRGRYYTVSGKTPQLTGVLSDIVVSGPLSESDVGEKFSKYPLENDHIKPNFDDDLSDIPFLKRDKIRRLYRFGLQERLTIYSNFLEKLKSNSTERLGQSNNYQNLLKEIKKKDDANPDEIEKFGQNDIQLEEADNIMKDLLILMLEKGLTLPPIEKEIPLSVAPFNRVLEAQAA